MFKRPCKQAHTDFAPELHSPEKTSNSHSHNITTSSTSNSHNYSPTIFYFSSRHGGSLSLAPDERTIYLTGCCIAARSGPSVRPSLQGASKKLDTVQTRVPKADIESEESFNHSNKMEPSLRIPSASPIFHRPRQKIRVGHSSQTHGLRTSRQETSTRKKGKRRQTEDTLKSEPENDRLLVNQKATTDNFFYFLFFLLFCSLLFFLVMLFLLSVLFLLCLYIFHLP